MRREWAARMTGGEVLPSSAAAEPFFAPRRRDHPIRLVLPPAVPPPSPAVPPPSPAVPPPPPPAVPPAVPPPSPASAPASAGKMAPRRSPIRPLRGAIARSNSGCANAPVPVRLSPSAKRRRSSKIS